MDILLATKNNGKIAELRELLGNLPIILRSLNEFPNAEDVIESGTTFTENAQIKAREYSLLTGLHAIADDSGLEVDSLGGAPGVFSARYGGAHSTDEEKIIKLLNELEGIPEAERNARFVCVIAAADDHGKIIRTETGICNGRIAFKALGTNGFGYDPIFIPEGFSETFGELPDSVKKSISHRGKATSKIIEFLETFSAG